MKIQWTVDEGHKRLLLIFAGWAMDSRPFAGLHVDGCDIAVVWDYRSLQLDTTRIDTYGGEVCLFAWSFGVFMASMAMSRGILHPMLSVAVNGSPVPVSDEQGIPQAIFDGTLNGLNERNLDKFYRRMCSSAADYQAFIAGRPLRPLDELRQELEAIAAMAAGDVDVTNIGQWDRAVISTADRIFPIDNLHRAWSRLPRVREIDGGAHLPDFQRIIDQELIDKSRVARRFAQSHATYRDHAEAQQLIVRRLWDLWRQVQSTAPEVVFEAGCGTGMFTELYVRAWHPRRVILCDLAPAPELGLIDGAELTVDDAERAILQLADNSVGAVASSSTMQWFDSPSRWIAQAVRVVKPGGIVALSTFAPGNFAEIEAVTHMPLRYYTVAELSAMLPPECQLLYAIEEEIVRWFDSPRQVLRHLRLTGVNGMRHTLESARRFLTAYPQPAADGRVSLTFRPIYLIIKKNETK